jgi:hypothetical protein
MNSSESNLSAKDFVHVVCRIESKDKQEDIPAMWERAKDIATGYYAVTFTARRKPDRLVAVFFGGHLFPVYPRQISVCEMLPAALTAN